MKANTFNTLWTAASASLLIGTLPGAALADTIVITNDQSGTTVVTGDQTSTEDTVTITNSSIDSIGTLTDDDTVTITNSTLTNTGTSVALGTGDDTFTFNSGTIYGDVEGGTGADIITIEGGTIKGDVSGDNLPVTDDPGSGSFNDIITMNGGTIEESLLGGSGNDTIIINGGTILVDVGGDGFTGNTEATVPGNDTIIVNGGTIAYGIFGNSGTDSITVNGGKVSGTIEAETVTLTGGTVDGTIEDFTSLTIDDSSDSTASLTVADGSTLSGSSATGTIRNSSLGTGLSATGFSSLTIDNSSLGTASGTALINDLMVINGSTVTIGTGSSSLRNLANTAYGDLTVQDSTFSFINGQAGDVMQVGDLSISNAIFGTDVDVAAGQGDQLIVHGVVTSNGVGTLLVNSTDGTIASGRTVIPLSPVDGETAPTTAPAASAILSNYTVEPTGTAGLNTYELAEGSSGGIYLITTPNETAIGMGTAPKVAIDSRPPSLVSREVSNLTGDAIDDMMNLGGDDARAGGPVVPLFGIFASATAGRYTHNGFEVSSPTGVTGGPEFSSSEFSALFSLEYDVAEGLDLTGPINAKAGVFGGYGTSRVKIGSSSYLSGLGFGNAGDGRNESGIIGGYGLVSYGTNYALLAGTGFFGTTSVNNDVLNSTGSYGTDGYAISGSVGRIIPFAERWRFDLRASALWTEFYGDSFTDSANNRFGASEVSFGSVKLQPGVYTSLTLGDISLQPFVRAEIAQRFGYENNAVIQGTQFSFDDSDFSASLALGTTAAITDRVSLKFEGATKLSGDSSSVTGKLGLKFKLGG